VVLVSLSAAQRQEPVTVTGYDVPELAPF
jgi:hypothetical protein